MITPALPTCHLATALSVRESRDQSGPSSSRRRSWQAAAQTTGSNLPDDVIEKMFVVYRGQAIRLPEKFGPAEKYLDYHRTTVFQAG
jgi:hypothetical protein